MVLNRTPTKPGSTPKRTYNQDSPDTEMSEKNKKLRKDQPAKSVATNCSVDLQAMLSNEFAQQKLDIANLIESKFKQLQVTMDEHKNLLLGKIAQLESENAEPKQTIKSQNDAILKLQEQMNNNYLVFSGIPENESENPKETIDKILRDKLGLQVQCTTAKRMHSELKNRPKPTKVYFVSQEDRHLVFSKKSRMPTGQYINPYHPPAVLAVTRKLQARRKELREDKIEAKINYRTYELTYND